jgi:hypothetical protein
MHRITGNSKPWRTNGKAVRKKCLARADAPHYLVDGSMAWRGTRWEVTRLERAEVMRDMTSRVKWTAYHASVYDPVK